MHPLLRNIWHGLSWLVLASPFIVFFVLSASDIWYEIRYWYWYMMHGEYNYLGAWAIIIVCVYLYASNKTRMDREYKEHHTPKQDGQEM